MDIIWVSDLHLTDPVKTELGQARADFVKRSLNKALAIFPTASLCVVTGDLADDCEPGVYTWLKACFDAMPIRCVALVGNHDDRSAFAKAFATGSDGGATFVQQEIETPEARLLFLDTLKPGSDGGTLCADRLQWLESRLSLGTEKPVLLFMHHPPCDIGDPRIDALKLDNPEDLAAVLRQAPSTVERIFFGHVHRASTQVWTDIACCSIGALVPHADGAEMPVSFGCIQIQNGQMHLTTRTLSV
ncbi:MAG: metallophosphoesterase [Pseudomonadota bacterium]